MEVANNERLVDSNIRLESNTLNVSYGNEFAASKSLCKLLKVCLESFELLLLRKTDS